MRSSRMMAFAGGGLLLAVLGLHGGGCFPFSSGECQHCGTSAPVGTGGNGGSGGSVATCVTVADCPGKDTFCAVRACHEGVCGFTPRPAGEISSQKYGDCKRRECNGMGNIIEVGEPADIYSDWNDCTQDVCVLGEPAHPPHGMTMMCSRDFGSGNCDGAGNCVECTSVPGMCGADVCDEGICVHDHCINNALDDGMKEETDIDCGGGHCRPCADGVHCEDDDDCLSGKCGNNGNCASPSCMDDKINGSETDLGCGGADCPPCADGQSCKTHTDCQSGVCYCAGGQCASPDDPYVCLPPTCQDGTQNGDETGIDCGGSCEMGCPPG